jgi:hypothetical protein
MPAGKKGVCDVLSHTPFFPDLNPLPVVNFDRKRVKKQSGRGLGVGPEALSAVWKVDWRTKFNCLTDINYLK